MNSKQRKIANKIRERAELDGSAQLQKLAAERLQFAEYQAGAHKEFQRLGEQLAKERLELTKNVEAFKKEMLALKQKFFIDKDYLEDANVIRDVLLQLELDEDPAQIALNIRKQFNLLIPEW